MKIGERIKIIFKELPKQYDIKWFAARLHCEPRNIYRIFEKENIDIVQLGNISRILNHNFFYDLAKSFEENWQSGSSVNNTK